MCIRALDYLPPVDMNYGDYLRALITADADLVADDVRGYRIAMVEAFRRRGIYPKDCRSLSVDGLVWSRPDDTIEIAWLADEAFPYLAVTPAQLAMLLEGIDWRAPVRTDRPRIAG